MRQAESVADALRRLRKTSGFSPVWSFHAEHERLPDYYAKWGLDKLICEKVVSTGTLHSIEVDVHGRETVHVRGRVDGLTVDVVVGVAHTSSETFVLIITLKPK